jgi:hypothetical protein
MVPAIFAAVALTRIQSVTSMRDESTDGSLFGPLDGSLDRVSPCFPIGAFLLWMVTTAFGGDGLMAASGLSAALCAPGALLAWPCLWALACGQLRERSFLRVSPGVLESLRKTTVIHFEEANSLVTNELRVVAVMPAPDARADQWLAAAIALIQDQDTDVAKALLQFGVEHRIRIKPATGTSASAVGIVRGSLPDPVGIAAIGPLQAMSLAGFSVEGLESTIDHHQELGRLALLVATEQPVRSTYGVIFLAHPLRKGAVEAVRILREANYAVQLGETGVQLPGAVASLRQLRLQPADPELRDLSGTLRVACASKSLDGRAPSLTLVLGASSAQARTGVANCWLGSDDPRMVPEAIGFATAFARRKTYALGLIGTLPGAVLLLLASGLLPLSQAISIVGVMGIALAAVLPQALRFAPRVIDHSDR